MPSEVLGVGVVTTLDPTSPLTSQIHSYVTAAGWWAGNTWLNFCLAGVKPSRSMRRVVTATWFTMVMNTISILWAGTHKPHRKVADLVLSVLVITSS